VRIPGLRHATVILVHVEDYGADPGNGLHKIRNHYQSVGFVTALIQPSGFVVRESSPDKVPTIYKYEYQAERDFCLIEAGVLDFCLRVAYPQVLEFLVIDETTHQEHDTYEQVEDYLDHEILHKGRPE